MITSDSATRFCRQPLLTNQVNKTVESREHTITVFWWSAGIRKTEKITTGWKTLIFQEHNKAMKIPV